MRREFHRVWLALALGAAAGCSKPGATPAARETTPPAARDTLLDALGPHLSTAIALWQYVDRGASIQSFHRASEEPFTLHDIHRYDLMRWEEARRRRLFAIWSPDSTRFIDPDTKFNATMDERTVELTRGEKSAPALVDLKTRSTSGLETSWRTGDCDGAFWLANERFAITGTSAGGDTTGARYAFVRVFDLNAGTVVEYQTAPAESLAFKAFRAARDSAWTAYFRTRLP